MYRKCEYMFVSCVHLVTVLNAELFMTCSLLMQGHSAEPSNDCLVCSHENLLLFTPSLCACNEMM